MVTALEVVVVIVVGGTVVNGMAQTSVQIEGGHCVSEQSTSPSGH